MKNKMNIREQLFLQRENKELFEMAKSYAYTYMEKIKGKNNETKIQYINYFWCIYIFLLYALWQFRNAEGNIRIFIDGTRVCT